MPTISTTLTKILGIKHPILLAPMGSASGGILAAAVSHAGGLWFIGSGYADSALMGYFSMTRRAISRSGYSDMSHSSGFTTTEP
jgi:NAD(P)H-dependent flavin oxidoreductase YrpB (nitropropane dioxygenase family)